IADHPAPAEEALKALKANRQLASRLTADREAASLNLSLGPESGAPAAELAIDGGPLQKIPVSDEPMVHPIRRKAQLRIGGWGRIELSRGIGTADLDQIEIELGKCNEDFANLVTPLGISATDPQALDMLLERASEHRLRTPELDDKRKQLKKL